MRKWRWISYSSPDIYDPKAVDGLMLVSQTDPEEMARRLAREEGLFGGISAAGPCWVALDVAEQVRKAAIVVVICDRCLSTGIFPA